MNITTLAALLVVTTALFAYINVRVIRWPTTIGVMSISLAFSLVIIVFASREIVGGILLGIALGFLAHWLIKSIDDFKVQTLITLATVMGGYVLANALDTSAPIAMVCAGLVIGHYARNLGITASSKIQLNNFWELLDEILNAMLFVLMGLELLTLRFHSLLVVAVIGLIPLLLLSRHAAAVLTWAGLRGAISVAMALSLPEGPTRDIIVSITYVLVIFSVLVQGSTVRPLIRAIGKRQ